MPIKSGWLDQFEMEAVVADCSIDGDPSVLSVDRNSQGLKADYVRRRQQSRYLSSVCNRDPCMLISGVARNLWKLRCFSVDAESCRVSVSLWRSSQVGAALSLPRRACAKHTIDNLYRHVDYRCLYTFVHICIYAHSPADVVID